MPDAPTNRVEGIGLMGTLDEHSVITKLCDGTSGDIALEQRLMRAMFDCFRLWQERHAKYGRGNISRFGGMGCLVRDADKTARLEEYYLHGKTGTPDESITDSWRDKVNYSLMGLLCFQKQWPGSPEEKSHDEIPF